MLLPAVTQLRDERRGLHLQLLHLGLPAVGADELGEERLVGHRGVDHEELLALEPEAGVARHPQEEPPEPVRDVTSDEQQRLVLQLVGQPAAKVVGVVQEGVDPLETVFLMDRVLRGRRCPAKSARTTASSSAGGSTFRACSVVDWLGEKDSSCAQRRPP